MGEIRVASEAKLNHELNSKKLDMGKLGTWFGNGDQAAKYISGLAVLILIIIGGILCIGDRTWEQIFPFWKDIIYPIITLYLGYLFGKKN